jgi:hypothetical protein
LWRNSVDSNKNLIWNYSFRLVFWLCVLVTLVIKIWWINKFFSPNVFIMIFCKIFFLNLFFLPLIRLNFAIKKRMILCKKIKFVISNWVKYFNYSSQKYSFISLIRFEKFFLRIIKLLGGLENMFKLRFIGDLVIFRTNKKSYNNHHNY